MKKLLYSFLLLLIIIPNSVYAAGYISVSPSSLTIEEGSSKTFAITAYNTIGDVSIKSDNSSIASVNLGEWGTGMVDEAQTKTGYVTVSGNSVGKTTITMIIDAATFDGDDLSGQTKTITVNVIAKSVPTPEPTPEPTPSPTPAPTPSPTPSAPSKSFSKNNNIYSLEIDGYELTKIDNNNYTLSVQNDVESININATPEDPKATILGTGLHELAIGENNIEIIITSESGAQNKIIIKVTRKEDYFLEDVDYLLNNNSINEINIALSKDDKITKEDLTKIKESTKTVRFNYFDENKQLLYTWFINGKEIRENNEFLTTINFIADNTDEIYKISNYADGLYIKFFHNGDLPSGTKVRLYVGNKFADEKSINLYYYNKTNNELELVKNNLIVHDGFIEFDINHCSDYFATMSILSNAINTQKTSSNLFIILIIILTTIIISLIVYIIIKIKPFNKKKGNKIETLPIYTMKQETKEEAPINEVSINSDNKPLISEYNNNSTVESSDNNLNKL